MRNNLVNSKRSQHEIVGFIVIVAVVTIVGLMFLLFTGKGEAVKQNSVEVSHLLQAFMYYTTDCAKGYVPNYYDGQDLIKACYNNKECSDNRKACDTVAELFPRIINKSLDIHKDSPNKAYKLNIYYKDLELDLREEIFKNEEGVFVNCSREIGGIHSIPVGSISSNLINIELEVCKG